MICSEDIKKIVLGYGADLCGIASIDRFGDAPKGFHPCDVLPNCKSVVVFAMKFLTGTIQCNSTVPYTIVKNILSERMDNISVQLCQDLEDKGAIAIPTGTNGPTEYDILTNRSRNIVSAKHCAVAAGLGKIGKNTLLITPQLGNMVWLSVILTNLELNPDPTMTGSPCPIDCDLCVNACPVHALGEPQMKQSECWNYAFSSEKSSNFKIKCFKCRTICPHCLGTDNGRLNQ